MTNFSMTDKPETNISTHVLDAVLGKPAAGIAITLEHWSEASSLWHATGSGTTDADGRCRNLGYLGGAGVYRLVFAVDGYFRAQGRSSIYPEVVVTVRVDGLASYHIPLLLSDNSYTTYRGS
jgi:5-hydroxyisourate hydrolase